MRQPNHLKSPLWKLWQKHLFAGFEKKLPLPEWIEWKRKKAIEWRAMKADGLIDVKGLSIKKPRTLKRGRKRGRRKKKC
jgi:hypothetical protein